ncbi:uncharacterized protein METZ01_LOCUS17441, partial [marine metagenome]
VTVAPFQDEVPENPPECDPQFAVYRRGSTVSVVAGSRGTRPPFREPEAA